jgi:hypothetical protein
MLTFFPAQSGPWKCGARTCCTISSSPLSVAFPMTVIGVSLLTKRLCFRSALLAASAQIACTNETGSTGGRVLKNTTRPHQMINIRHLQQLSIPQSVSNLIWVNRGSIVGLLMFSSSLWISTSMSSSSCSASPPSAAASSWLAP